MPIDGSIRVDAENGFVFVNGERLELQRLEVRIFMALWERQPRTVSYGLLMEDMYGLEVDWPDRAGVSVRICNLRHKIKHTPLTIENVWGQGYRILVETEQEKAA